MQSHCIHNPRVFINWQFCHQILTASIVGCSFLRKMHAFHTFCSLFLGFYRMSFNAGSTARGMCRAHQGAEEWRGTSGLQNKRWHHCPTQVCAQQEPYSADSEWTTKAQNRSRDLTRLFISFAPPNACLQTSPVGKESLQAGSLWQRVLQQLSTEGA